MSLLPAVNTMLCYAHCQYFSLDGCSWLNKKKYAKSLTSHWVLWNIQIMRYFGSSCGTNIVHREQFKLQTLLTQYGDHKCWLTDCQNLSNATVWPPTQIDVCYVTVLLLNWVKLNNSLPPATISCYTNEIVNSENLWKLNYKNVKTIFCETWPSIFYLT